MTDERIEELWKKACDIVTPSGPVRYLFARLIQAETARECVEIVGEVRYERPIDADAACFDVAKAIRRKFEVRDA